MNNNKPKIYEELEEKLEEKLDKVNPVAEGPLTVNRIRFVNPDGTEMGYLYSDNPDLDEISLNLTGAQFSRLGDNNKPIQDIYVNHLYSGNVHASLADSMFMFYKSEADVRITVPDGGTWIIHMLAGSSWEDIGNHPRAETHAGGSELNWGYWYKAYIWGYRVA